MGGNALILARRVNTNIREDNLPKFVKMGVGGCLRLVRQGPEHMEYWRDGGAWGVGYKVLDGKLYSVHNSMDWLDNKPLTPILEAEWRECNGVYAPEKV